MANDLNQSLYDEDEIDLKEIFKILRESKKLIISTILIFTTASIIYSLSLKPSFLTSTILEIGYYEMPDGNQKLIEKPSDLISDLKILLLKNPYNKLDQNVSMNSFEGKLINFNTTSSSVEQNENILNELINYIHERHSNLGILSARQNKDRLSVKIELIKSEISYIKQKMQLDLEENIITLETTLPILNQEISQLNQVIIEDSNNLNLLKGTNLDIKRASNSPTLEQIISSYKSKVNELKIKRGNSISAIRTLSKKLENLKKDTLQSDELFKLERDLKNTENELQILMAQTQVKTQPIGNIETQTIKPKTQLTILLGIIIGFVTGIFLTFINNFIKSYRESDA